MSPTNHASAPARHAPRSSSRLASAVLWIAASACVAAIGANAFAWISSGASAPRALANGLVPAVLLGLAASGLFGAGRRRRQFAIALVSTLVSLQAGAVVLEWNAADPLALLVEQKLRAGASFDVRTTRRFVLDARASGEEVFPLVIPTALLEPAEGGSRSCIELGEKRVIVLSGRSHTRTVLGNESGEYVVVRTDRYGFNNPDAVWDLEPTEIVAVGDSFTMGKCVPEPENAIGRIRASVPATLNLGFAGNSPLYNLATLIEYGAERKPRTVLWLYYPNDLAPFELGRDRETPDLLRYLEAGYAQRLKELQPAIDGALERYGEAELLRGGPNTIWEQLAISEGGRWTKVRRSLLLTPIRNDVATLLGDAGTAWKPDVAMYGRILRRAAEVIRGGGGRAVFVYVPDVEEFQPHRRSYLWPAFAVRNEVLSAARAEGFEIVDLKASLASRPDVLGLYAWTVTGAHGLPHLNAAGYAVAAQSILAHIIP